MSAKLCAFMPGNAEEADAAPAPAARTASFRNLRRRPLLLLQLSDEPDTEVAGSESDSS